MPGRLAVYNLFACKRARVSQRVVSCLRSPQHTRRSAAFPYGNTFAAQASPAPARVKPARVDAAGLCDLLVNIQLSKQRGRAHKRAQKWSPFEALLQLGPWPIRLYDHTVTLFVSKP